MLSAANQWRLYLGLEPILETPPKKPRRWVAFYRSASAAKLLPSSGRVWLPNRGFRKLTPPAP